MALEGYDLVITGADNTHKGFMFSQDKQFGEPCVKVSVSPEVPLNTGSSTPSNSAGGVYDVRDASGEKAITHLDWTLGSGQRSLDADGSSPYAYLTSANVDVESSGQLKLLKGATYTPMAGSTGPLYSFGDYLFIASQNGDIKYSSNNGYTWREATWSTGQPLVPVGSFTTDGVFLYTCAPSGTLSGAYKGTLSGGAWSFGRLGSSTEHIAKIAYHSGFLYGAVNYLSGSNSSKVAILDSTMGYVLDSSLSTPAVLAYCTTVALIAGKNCVYWVVSQGGRSYVYKLYYDPTATTPILATEQYAEFPNGFVATCAFNYLSRLFVGGYWKSSTAARGMGSVYMVSEGVSSPLLDIGERPEHTLIPDDPENDNRIYAMCAGTKDLYIITNRGCYRWDINKSGYSHMFDLTGSGYGTQVVAWNSGSDYSWDGRDYTSISPPHGRFPTKWTATTISGTPVWTHTDGIAVLSGGVVQINCDPDGAEELNNANGTTLELKTGAGMSGEIQITIKDGAKEANVHIAPAWVEVHKYGPLEEYTHFVYDAWEIVDWDDHDEPIYGWVHHDEWRWIPDPQGVSTWTYTTMPVNHRNTATVSYINKGGARVVRINLKGSVLTVTVDGDTATQYSGSDGLIATTTKRLYVRFGGDSRTDYLYLNSSSAVLPGSEVETLSYADATFHNGSVITPYSVASSQSSKLITDVTSANPAAFTTEEDHGYTTGDYVHIVGTGLAALDDLDHIIERTGDKSFQIALSGAPGSSTGWAYPKDNCKEGFAQQGSHYAATGSLTTSESNFHTGTMKKDFRSVEILHEPIMGGTLGCTIWVDGDPYSLTGTSSRSKTTFPINMSGYSVKCRVTINADSSLTTTPIIKAVNVTWDFIKIKKHQYVIDCRAGANSGRDSGDANAAIQYLFDVSDKRLTLEDAASGEYEGIINSVELKKANRSSLEGVSGIVTLAVREI